MAKPIKKFQDYPVSVSVFESDFGFSVSLQKARKNKETGKYEYNSINLYDGDLLKVAELLKEAYSFCKSQQENIDLDSSEEPKPEPEEKEIKSIDSIDDEIPF